MVLVIGLLQQSHETEIKKMSINASIKNLIDLDFKKKFGEIPEKDSDLRLYVNSIKDTMWKIDSAKSIEIIELKNEVNNLKQELQESKSQRELDLENKANTFEYLYNQLLDKISSLYNQELENKNNSRY